MFPDDPKPAPRAGGHGGVTATKPRGTNDQPSADRDVVPVVVGGRSGQRSTLYDSFELSAMVVRLDRLLNGDGGRRPRRGPGSWLAVPKVLFGKIKCAFHGGRQGGGG